MNMKLSKILIFLLFLTLPSNVAFAVTYDNSGLGDEPPPPPNYNCVNVGVSGHGAQYNDKFFSIEMSAFCYIDQGTVLISNNNVGATGRYYYQEQIATEKVYKLGPGGSGHIFEVRLQCMRNPWAYGLENANCTPMDPPTNHLEGVVINGPYPLFAKYMDSGLQSMIKKAADWKSPEELLADWDPNEQTGGASALSFLAPQNGEMINQSMGYYPLQLEQVNSNSNVPETINYQVETLEDTPEYIGDIKIPDTHSQWWQPFAVQSMPVTETDPIILNIGIASGAFAGKPGSYRIRARAHNSQGAIGGWSSWQYFCVGPAGSSCTQTYSGQLPGGGPVFMKLNRVTLDLKTMQATDIFFNKKSADIKEVQMQKKKFFNQLLSKKLKQPTIKKRAGQKDGKSQLQKIKPLNMNVASVSSTDIGEVLTIKLNFGHSKSLINADLEIKSLTNGNTVWKGTLSPRANGETIKIAHKDMDLASQPFGEKDYNLFVDKKRIGKVSINNRAALKKSSQKMSFLLKPQLKIGLSLLSRDLKAGDQATILVSVKNTGKAAIKKTVPYTLHCNGSPCPFGTSGKTTTSTLVALDLKPNQSTSFKINSEKLEAGDYQVTLKTEYGLSNKLKFKAKRVMKLKRSSNNIQRTKSPQRSNSTQRSK